MDTILIEPYIPVAMKTAIFTWLLLLPLQIYAYNSNSKLLNERESLIQQLKAKSIESSALFGVEIPARNTVNYALVMRLIEKDNAIIQKLTLQNRIQEASILFENESYKAITLSQEREIQLLKNALKEKDQQIKSQEFTTWKYESTILIFSVGMLIFAFLYIRSKVNFSFLDSVILNPVLPQEK